MRVAYPNRKWLQVSICEFGLPYTPALANHQPYRGNSGGAGCVNFPEGDGAILGHDVKQI